METLRPNEQRAKLAVTLLWISMAVTIVSLFSSYLQYNLLQDIDNGVTVSSEDATFNDLREGLIGIISLIVLVVSAITFIQWFRRAYYNLHLKVGHLAFTEGWAAGAWFVPVLNLFRPYQIMRELYVETKESLKENNITPSADLNMAVVGLWWTLWVVSAIAGQVSLRISLNAESVDQLINSTIADIVGNIIQIPLAIIAVKVVKSYAQVEPQLNEVPDEGMPKLSKDLPPDNKESEATE